MSAERGNLSKLEIQKNMPVPGEAIDERRHIFSIIPCPLSLENEAKILRIGFILLVVCLALVVLGYTFNTKQLTKDALSSRQFCNTPGCVLSAANILIRIDRNEDPCDNFYKFACGRFIKNLDLPQDKTHITTLSSTSDRLSQSLNDLIEQEIKEDDVNSTKFVKKFYQSCMNTELIETKGVEPLRDIILTLGGWPAVRNHSWVEDDNTTWVDTLIKMRQIGFSTDYLFRFGITTDVKNSSWRIIQLDQAKLGMPSRSYMIKGLDDEDVQAYLQFQIDMALLMGAENTTELQKDMERNIEIEIEIANASLTDEQRRDLPSLYNKMKVDDLTKISPNIPWLKIINQFLKLETEITGDELILVNVPQYLIFMDQFLQTLSKREIQNYLMWHVAASSCFYLSSKCREVELKYSLKMFGIGKLAPRWKDCMDLVSGELSFAVASMYVRNYFNETSKDEAEDMVKYIMNTFLRSLRQIQWMDQETKQKAMEKAKLMKTLIGYPKEILDEAVLLKHYNSLNMSDTDLLENMKALSLYGFEYSSKKLREKVIKTNWKTYGAAAVVNAFYSPVDNAIIFPAGILQDMFFDIHRPKYMNYGGIGLVIGHEIIHGFDDEGSHFNSKGDLENWWDVSTREKFLNKSQCIISQYDNYYLPEVNMTVNGFVTQGENIADNGGTRAARSAYESWKVEHGPEPRLPGLPFTPEQLFWISSAHLWCSKERDEFLKMSILSKRHSPARFRINGPASNSEMFSKDWGCSKNSKMNRAKKCVLW